MQEELLLDTYRETNVDPLKVSYIEAHGTGTKVGDVEEMGAISAVFCRPGRERPLLIGSVKSNMGHAESASGKPTWSFGTAERIESLRKLSVTWSTGIEFSPQWTYFAPAVRWRPMKINTFDEQSRYSAD